MTSGPLLRFQALCLDTDAAHLELVAAFWSTALGWAREPGHAGAVLRGAGPGESLWIDVVPEPIGAKHRTHLDVRVEDWHSLLDRGASIVDETSFPWVWLRDPEGGDLCAFPLRSEGGGAGLYEVCTDCGPDAMPIARWWADVLGAEARQEDDDWAYVTQPPGAPFETWVFCPVPEPKRVKNRLHLDFRATRPDSVDLLVDRGATVLREPEDSADGIAWHVLADPEGNELCVFPPDEADS